MIKIIVGSRPGGAKKSNKIGFGGSVDAFGCLGLPPDAFFVDFASNLTRNLHVFSERKSAITRTTHPQHSFSKGGGFAKRPQYNHDDNIITNSNFYS